MTRDFNKQRRERDDMRPYTRRQPPHRPEEERLERQDRPRLNRETVDRAWENGAQINHADYHGRNGNNRPRPGQQGRQGRQDRQYDQRQRFSDQNGRNSSGSGYRRDYGSNHYEREREEGNYRNDRYPSSRGNAGQRPRSYNNNRFDERRSNDQQERNRYERPDFRGNDRNYGRPYPNREQGRGYSNRSSRYPEQDRRSSPYNGRGQRPSSGGAPYETRSPRRTNYRQHEQGQYEGDYERFSSFEQHPERRQTGARRFARRQSEERHVTRLSDGRALKGPRPAQRKNAQFWSEISEDTDALVPHPHENEQAGQGTHRSTGSAGSPRKREKNVKPESGNNVPRPSQRGFKWPRPEPEE